MNKPQPEQPPRIPAGDTLDRAVDLVVHLRRKCPWDARQTPESLCRYLLEESHEVADAIMAGDADALRDELGDLLLNLAFQVVIAEERQSFSRDDVFAGLEEKVRRRHPHVFEGRKAEPWHRMKARERGNVDLDDRLGTVPRGVPPLLRAHRLQEAAAEVGFDWPSVAGAVAKVREELEEVEGAVREGDARRVEEELGDLLFSAVNVSRLAGVDATVALLRANAKFHRRFRALETAARARGLDLESATLSEMDALWDEVKEHPDTADQDA